MKKIITLLVLLLTIVACGQKEETSESEIVKLLADGYLINATSFDDQEWKGLFEKDDDHIVVKAKLNAELYEEANEVFFEDDKYQEFIKGLEVSESYSVNDKLPSDEELQKYVGKKFGDIEDEGFYNSGYCESDNYQYNFTYENDVYCLVVKSSADTPIYTMDDLSANDIRELVVCEIVDCYLSNGVLNAE